jgi:hypothetical protein
MELYTYLPFNYHRSRKMAGLKHTAHIGQMRSVNNILSGNLKGRDTWKTQRETEG